MSEYDSIKFCPFCEKKQVFTMSGSGSKGFCMECGNSQDFTKKDFIPSKSKIYKGLVYDSPKGIMVEYRIVRTNGQILHAVYDTDGFFADSGGLTETEQKMITRRYFPFSLLSEKKR